MSEYFSFWVHEVNSYYSCSCYEFNHLIVAPIICCSYKSSANCTYICGLLAVINEFKYQAVIFENSAFVILLMSLTPLFVMLLLL